MPKPLASTVIPQLREIRVALRLNKSELARMAEVGRSTVEKLDSRRPVNETSAQKVIYALENFARSDGHDARSPIMKQIADIEEYVFKRSLGRDFSHETDKLFASAKSISKSFEDELSTILSFEPSVDILKFLKNNVQERLSQIERVIRIKEKGVEESIRMTPDDWSIEK